MDRLATLIAAGMLAIGLAVGVQVARRFPGFAGGHWIWGWNSLLLGGIAYGIVDLGGTQERSCASHARG
jgi:hypothetical protein